MPENSGGSWVCIYATYILISGSVETAPRSGREKVIFTALHKLEG